MMKHSRKPCLHGVYAGLFGKVFTAFIAAAAVTLAYGADYYVDANNGNDAWDGTTAAIPDQATIDAGGTIAGPRKTLHAMMSDERVVAGDTVWAAEGNYNEGGTVNGEGTTTNRVQVKGGVMLRASGSRDKTFISGANGTEGNNYSAGATRCVFFLPPVNEEDGYGIVKGFTLQHGRAGSEEAIEEYGGASFGAGLLVECDFLDNGCYDKNRGGTMNEGTALRCRFVSYNKGYLGYKGTKIIDSLVESSRPFYDSCYAYNCTFSGDSYLRSKGRARNCLYIGGGASNKDQNANDTKSYHYNTFSYFEFYDGCTVVDDNCRVVNSKTAPYDPVTFRPSVSSQAIDGGTLENYALATNGWKQAWLDECGKDYYGGERVVNGKIDVGCGEAQKSDIVIEDSSDGLVVAGVDAGTTRIPDDSSIDVVFSRNFTSDKLCIGVKVNGEFHSFGGTTSDVPYSVTFPAILGLSYNIEAIYEENQKDWYVSPSGDNANKGYHRKWPRRTLDKAMELATENAGHIVHAAAGTYDSFAEGEEYASANSRVTVKEGVGLVADEWPLRETVIKGASSFFKDCMEAFRDENADVIISAGKTFHSLRLKNIPPNIHIYPSVPQIEVLKISDVFVTHGGMNSVSEALVYGVPMVVIPFVSDQPVNAQCVEKIGAGKMLPYSSVNKISLKKTVLSVASDEYTRNNLKQIRHQISQAPGNAGGAELIIQYFKDNLR